MDETNAVNQAPLDTQFILIQHFMIKDLKLQGTELLVYAVIYGFSQDGVNEYNVNFKWLAEMTGSTPDKVEKAIMELLRKGLLQYIVNPDYIPKGSDLTLKTKPRE